MRSTPPLAFPRTSPASDLPPPRQADDAELSVLCNKCAAVMRQQALPASSFLSRFFSGPMLSAHCELLGKSGKGGVPTLAERAATAWVRSLLVRGIGTVAAARPRCVRPTTALGVRGGNFLNC